MILQKSPYYADHFYSLKMFSLRVGLVGRTDGLDGISERSFNFFILRYIKYYTYIYIAICNLIYTKLFAKNSCGFKVSQVGCPEAKLFKNTQDVFF